MQVVLFIAFIVEGIKSSEEKSDFVAYCGAGYIIGSFVYILITLFTYNFV